MSDQQRYAFHVDDNWDPASGEKARGNSTAFPLNVQYRVASIAQYVKGDWLDLGCADGGYTEAILGAGASSVVGVDPEGDRIDEANRRQIPNASFLTFDGHTLPLEDDRFHGVFMNETMEHVFDERESLAEIHRVLHPDGVVVVISPNRWFPFEGHTTRIGKWTSRHPTPFIPWLPKRFSAPLVDARNYWPHELRQLISDSGFEIMKASFIWPVFEAVPWLPAPIIRFYQRHISLYARIPILRRFGVSNLIVARRI